MEPKLIAHICVGVSCAKERERLGMQELADMAKKGEEIQGVQLCITRCLKGCLRNTLLSTRVTLDDKELGIVPAAGTNDIVAIKHAANDL